jgi:hypothetical protein
LLQDYSENLQKVADYVRKKWLKDPLRKSDVTEKGNNEKKKRNFLHDISFCTQQQLFCCKKNIILSSSRQK